MIESDQELIGEIRAGNRVAFQELLERHYDAIFRIAYRFTGHTQDAQDVAQEICVKMPEKLKSFRGESNFSTWLYRVVVNACRDFQKKQSTHRTLETTYVEIEQGQKEDAADTGMKVAWLYRMLSQLEPALKETAMLILAEERSHAEAASILSCAESTISWRMYEIKKQLKELTRASYD